MKAFPVDDSTLHAIKHALGGAYTVDDAGVHTLVGAEYSLNDLLNFLSGYDPEKAVFTGYINGVEAYEYPDQVYSERDVIDALVNEVLTCRGLST